MISISWAIHFGNSAGGTIADIIRETGSGYVISAGCDWGDGLKKVLQDYLYMVRIFLKGIMKQSKHAPGRIYQSSGWRFLAGHGSENRHVSTWSQSK